MATFESAPQKAPTTTQLYENFINVYKAKTGVDTVPKVSIIRALAYATAAIGILLFRLGKWSYDQIFIQTADPSGVSQIGLQLGVNQKEGVKAILAAQVTGASTTIDKGTRYQYNNVVYETTANFTPIEGEVVIQVQAGEYGEGYNLDAGNIINLVSPSEGVPNQATITAITQSGQDVESDEDYYQRVLAKVQQQPQGGADYDYFSWSTEADGIVDIYLIRTEAGVLNVYPIAEGTGEDRIPTEAQKTQVNSLITKSEGSLYDDRKPNTEKVEIKDIINQYYDVYIYGFGVDRPQDLKNSIQGSLAKYFDSKRASNPSLNKSGTMTVIKNSEVLTIVNSLCEQYLFSVSGVVVYRNGAAIESDYPIPQTQIASLGSVTYAA